MRRRARDVFKWPNTVDGLCTFGRSLERQSLRDESPNRTGVCKCASGGVVRMPFGRLNLWFSARSACSNKPLSSVFKFRPGLKGWRAATQMGFQCVSLIAAWPVCHRMRHSRSTLAI